MVSSENLLFSCLTSRLIVRDEIPEVAIAAIKATTEILTKGNAFQRQKLLKAEVFSEALKLHNQRSHPQHSLGLLHAIIEHLSHELLTDDDLARQMFSLFEWVEYDYVLSRIAY